MEASINHLHSILYLLQNVQDNLVCSTNYRSSVISDVSLDKLAENIRFLKSLRQSLVEINDSLILKEVDSFFLDLNLSCNAA